VRDARASRVFERLVAPSNQSAHALHGAVRGPRSHSRFSAEMHMTLWRACLDLRCAADPFHQPVLRINSRSISALRAEFDSGHGSLVLGQRAPERFAFPRVSDVLLDAVHWCPSELAACRIGSRGKNIGSDNPRPISPQQRSSGTHPSRKRTRGGERSACDGPMYSSTFSPQLWPEPEAGDARASP